MLKRKEELFPFLSRPTTSRDWVTDKLIKTNSLMYLKFELYPEKAIIKYCVREVSELVPFILEQERNWRRTGEEVKKIEISRTFRSTVAALKPF